MAAGLPISGGISEQLWRDSSKEVFAALHHPFVKGVASGTLPKESFQHYVAQDAHFLQAFAKAFALGMAKSGSLPPSVFSTLSKLLKGVQDELRLHAGYAKEWGVTLEQLQTPCPATLAYTSFLLHIAEHQELVYILAAMTPCSRLYGFLGCQLAASYPQDGLPYADWVQTYSLPAYLELPPKTEALLDELAVGVPYGSLRQLYRTAMQLEVDFFSAQPLPGPGLPDVRILMVDFDDTCTSSDTISRILDVAVACAEAKAGGGEAGQRARQELERMRSRLVSNYAKKYETLMQGLLPEDADLPRQFDMEWLGHFIDELSEFDREMNQVVVESGILAGIPKRRLVEAGAEIGLQPGCLGCLKRAQQRRLPVHVVSVNWSSELVRAALRDDLTVAAENGRMTGKTASELMVHANELRYKDGVSTGDIARSVQCAIDKAEVLDRLLLKKAAASNGQAEGLSVYIGDSASDIAPLLSADIGIVVGKKRDLRRVMALGGMQMQALVAAPTQQRADEGTLFEAESWAEIEAFLFGPATSGTAQTAQSPAAAVRVPRVLTVAGSDSGGGAGIQADLKTYSARGVFGMSAITALTAQNTHGVRSVHTVPTAFLQQQMDVVLEDIGTDVIKTGMLPNAEAVIAVAERVKARNSVLVVDPVLVATSGDSLAEADVTKALIQHLFPLATVMTPNLPEASALLGGRKVDSLESMKQAARDLHAYGPKYVLVKGGHLADDCQAQVANGAEAGCSKALDVLFDGQDMVVLESEKVRTRNTHGTGCTLASAIAAELAKGHQPTAAIHIAKTYLTEALRRSASLQIGTGVQRPINHGFEVADWAAQQASTSGRTNECDLRVYAVTDSSCNAAWKRPLGEAVRLAILGGTTVIQIRQKQADGGQFCRDAEEVISIARKAGVAVIINDRIDVALATGADGVHVGQDDISAAAARKLLGPYKILGVSVKNVEQALKAQANGADYLGAGAVFPTSTKDTSVIGLGLLSEICKAVSIPVVSIGGVNVDNAGSTVAAGCAGVAVVSAVFGVPDPSAAAAELRRRVDAALERRQLKTV
ncbi:hypothetical protein WJX72_003863 [[Myrmecia] bisecta]|uniref:thiamine phosphate synthase n=1 Tax=[Myrmecia] bisecta TaxID=41462 RepID=A0AAW1R5K8_9CHLO